MSKKTFANSDNHNTENLHELLGRCQHKLLQSRIELSGLSALLKNMGDSELSADEFHGLGLALERIAEQVENSLTELSMASP